MIKEEKALKHYIEEKFNVKLVKVRVPFAGTYYVILELNTYPMDEYYELKIPWLFYKLDTIYDFLNMEEGEEESEEN